MSAGHAAMVAALRELHAPKRIYGECECECGHGDDDVAAGRAVEVTDIGYTCEQGYEYTVCAACCTDAAGGQTEDCACGHDHGEGLAICPTTAILDGSSSGAPSGLRSASGSDFQAVPVSADTPDGSGALRGVQSREEASP